MSRYGGSRGKEIFQHKKNAKKTTTKQRLTVYLVLVCEPILLPQCPQSISLFPPSVHKQLRSGGDWRTNPCPSRMFVDTLNPQSSGFLDQPPVLWFHPPPNQALSAPSPLCCPPGLPFAVLPTAPALAALAHTWAADETLSQDNRHFCLILGRPYAQRTLTQRSFSHEPKTWVAERRLSVWLPTPTPRPL